MPCETCGATLDEVLCGNIGLDEVCESCKEGYVIARCCGR